MEETRAIGWPRVFTIGRAGSAGAPALSHKWRDSALRPMATRRRRRAAPQSTTAGTPMAGRQESEAPERGEGWLVHSPNPWFQVKRSVCSGAVHRASQGSLRLMPGHVLPDTNATELRWEDWERAVEDFQPRQRAGAVELITHLMFRYTGCGWS